MQISQILKNYFAADVRGRAGSYVASRAVRILQGSDSGLWATVRGSDTYNVVIVFEDEELHMSCSCPYFIEHGVGCKHLWATILTAEQQRHLKEILRHQVLEVIFDDEEELPVGSDGIDDDELDFEDDWEDDGWSDTAAAAPHDRLRGEELQEGEKGTTCRLEPSLQPNPTNDAAARGRLSRQRLVRRAATSLRSGCASIVGPRAPDSRFGLPGAQEGRQLGQTKVSSDRATASRANPYGTGRGDCAAAVRRPVAAELLVQLWIWLRARSRFSLSTARCRAILPLLGRTGRLFARFGTRKTKFNPSRGTTVCPGNFGCKSAARMVVRLIKSPAGFTAANEKQSIAQPKALIGERRCLGGSRRLSR